MTFPRKAMASFHTHIVCPKPLVWGRACSEKQKKPARETKETVKLFAVDLLVQEQVNDQAITGAVCWLGTTAARAPEGIWLRATSRARNHDVDTIFDLASLTRLCDNAERDAVDSVWPDFGWTSGSALHP